MKTRAIKFDGVKLYEEQFELPQIKEDEILAKVVCDTLCLSTYKAYIQGRDHARIPNDVNNKPIIIGHEFCGIIIDVGEKWSTKFKSGDKFIIQPAINYNNSQYAPGYSYQYIGGSSTYIIIPNEIMEQDCLLLYDNDSPFYAGSLAEPLSCIVAGFKKMIHTPRGAYDYCNGIREGGNLIILGGAGPMGIASITYAINNSIKPKRIVVTDIVEENLNHAQKVVSVQDAAACGVELYYVLSNDDNTIYEKLINITKGEGYDDVFVYAAVRSLIELGDKLLKRDGCLNLFAGPSDKQFKSEINFYNIHYNSTHMVGLSGGTTNDMVEYINLVKERKLKPAALITHIGGLSSTVEAIPILPKIPGGKKLIYTHFDFPLTQISELHKLIDKYPVFKEINEIVKENKGLWSKEAEEYLLLHGDAYR